MAFNLRKSDAHRFRVYKRSERTYSTGEGFYYKTREKETIGPFVSRSEAFYDLNYFVQFKVMPLHLKNEDSIKYG